MFSDQEELLLRACLLDGPTALDAWNSWKFKNHPARCAGAVQRLFPLVLQNSSLFDDRDDAEWLEKLRDVSKIAWFRNRVLLDRGSSVLRLFQKAGIRTLILKGAAMIACYYKNPGLRPMADFDIAVEAARLAEADRVLREAGWKAKKRPIQKGEGGPGYLSFRRACEFEDEGGSKVDLHWHIFLESPFQETDRLLWESAVPVKINGVETLALSPGHQLMHICAHGMLWNEKPSLRWVSDAAVILKTDGDQINWQRWFDAAEKCRVVPALQEALPYLRRVFALPVPDPALDALRNARPSRTSRAAFEWGRRRPCLAGDFPFICFTYLLGMEASGRREKSCWDKWAGFVQYLKHTWGIENAGSVPFYFFSRAARRCAKGVF